MPDFSRAIPRVLYRDFNQQESDQFADLGRVPEPLKGVSKGIYEGLT